MHARATWERKDKTGLCCFHGGSLCIQQQPETMSGMYASAGVHARDGALELRSAQYYTQHSAGVCQGSKPSKLKGLAHESEAIHRVGHLHHTHSTACIFQQTC